MAEGYVEKQQKEYETINRHIAYLRLDAEDIRTLSEALRFTGNERLAEKLEIFAVKITHHVNAIEKSRKQEIDNYMELDQQSQKEFFNTLAQHGVVKKVKG